MCWKKCSFYQIFFINHISNQYYKILMKIEDLFCSIEINHFSTKNTSICCYYWNTIIFWKKFFLSLFLNAVFVCGQDVRMTRQQTFLVTGFKKSLAVKEKKWTKILVQFYVNIICREDLELESRKKSVVFTWNKIAWRATQNVIKIYTANVIAK